MAIIVNRFCFVVFPDLLYKKRDQNIFLTSKIVFYFCASNLSCSMLFRIAGTSATTQQMIASGII